jgi:hypothetical protein
MQVRRATHDPFSQLEPNRFRHSENARDLGGHTVWFHPLEKEPLCLSGITQAVKNHLHTCKAKGNISLLLHRLRCGERCCQLGNPMPAPKHQSLETLYFCLMYVTALPAWMSVYYMHAWQLQRPEGGVRSSETGVTEGLSYHVGAGNWPQSSGRAAEPSLQQPFPTFYKITVSY